MDYLISRFREKQYSSKYPAAARQLNQINEVLIRKLNQKNKYNENILFLNRSAMSSFDKDPNKVVLYEEGFENNEDDC